jgi:hypothetical protein
LRSGPRGPVRKAVGRPASQPIRIARGGVQRASRRRPPRRSLRSDRHRGRARGHRGRRSRACRPRVRSRQSRGHRDRGRRS